MASKLVFWLATGLLLVFVGPHVGNAEEDVERDTKCPFPCTQGGQHYCYPLPCPLPPCHDPVTDKGACCSHCPNGPNCLIKGQIVPQGQNITTNGQLCECRTGGDSHSALVICQRCFDLHLGGVGKRCM